MRTIGDTDGEMQSLAVTGASGFIGRALIAAAAARGLRVVALGRSANPPALPDGVTYRRFDPNDPTGPGDAFEGIDVVVHLAGESVAGRWTAAKKAAIAASRIEGTRNLVAALGRCRQAPRALICASGVGFYGNRGDVPCTEDAPPGDDFLAETCVGWEREARRAEALGIRVCLLRTGLALGDGGGALGALRTPFALGLGGPLGNGRQFVPWIHLDDLVALYLFAAETDAARGPLNAVAPDYATNARFTQAIGAALRRPALIPAPGFALRLVLGAFAQTLLDGQLAIPAEPLRLGFAWKHPNLERALQDVLAPSRQATIPHHFAARTQVPGTLNDAFAFFADAHNLERLTPPHLNFTIERVSGPMAAGATIDYRLRLHGIPMRWRTLIETWEPPHRFVDVQLHGPYALWRHEHRFEVRDRGVEITDDVDYVLPLMPLSTPALPIVRADVASIFAYRQTAIATLFTPS